MNTLTECFEAIVGGDREKSRQAARRVRKLAYGSSEESREKYEKIAALIRNAPKGYEHISEEWRQENFVMAISVRHPRQRRWLDEWGRLKDDRPPRWLND